MEKDIPCKWKSKESWSSNTHIRQKGRFSSEELSSFSSLENNGKKKKLFTGHCWMRVSAKNIDLFLKILIA